MPAPYKKKFIERENNILLIMLDETQDREILSLLLSLGLSEREAKVYCILLSRGEKLAIEIANLSGIPQPHVYSVLKSLQSKGLVNFLQEKAKKYSAIPLDSAIDKLIGEEERALFLLKEKGHEIAQKIKMNETGYAGEFKPVIGQREIEKKIMEMIQSVKSEILGLTSSLRLLHHIEYLPFLRNVRSRGIKFRVLTTFNPEEMEKIKPLIEAGMEIKFLTKTNLSSLLIVDGEMLIEVGFEELEKPLNFRIWTNHKEIVRGTRDGFETCWGKAKSLQEILKK